MACPYKKTNKSSTAKSTTKKTLTAKQKKVLRDKLNKDFEKHKQRIMHAHGIHHKPKKRK